MPQIDKVRVEITLRSSRTTYRWKTSTCLGILLWICVILWGISLYMDCSGHVRSTRHCKINHRMWTCMYDTGESVKYGSVPCPVQRSFYSMSVPRGSSIRHWWHCGQAVCMPTLCWSSLQLAPGNYVLEDYECLHRGPAHHRAILSSPWQF